MAVRLNYRNHAAEGNFRRILVELRKAENGEWRKTGDEERRYRNDVKDFETERAGYAYLYPSDGGERKEDYISTTAENIANYIGSHMFEAEKIVITDMCDRLILDTCGYFINSCPNLEFCKEIHPFLIPIQMGEKDAERCFQSAGMYRNSISGKKMRLQPWLKSG